MAQTHNLLERQLRRCFGDHYDIPKEWRPFIDAVNDAYWESDMDRGMLERSLDLSSQELLEANSEMRAVFQAIPDMLFRIDGEGTILNYKAGLETDFFLRPNELLGKRIQDVPITDVANQFRDAIEEVQRTGSVVNIEYSLILKGEEQGYEARLVPMPENEKIVIIRNITEHKRAEQKLQEFNRALQEERQIFIGGPVVIFKRRNAAGWPVEYVSKNVENVFGYTEEQFLSGRIPYAKIISPEDIERVTHEVSTYSNGEAESFTQKPYRAIREDGQTIWLAEHSTILRDDTGTITHYLGYVFDITRRKHAEEEIIESEEKLKAVIQGSHIPQYVIDKDHKVIYWNRALEEVTKTSARIMVGTRHHWSAFYRNERPCLADLLVEEDFERIASWYRGQYRKSKVIEGAYEALDFFPTLGKEGAWLHSTAAAIRDTKGNVIGAMETLEDITESVEAEEARKSAERTYRGIFENAVMGISQATLDGRYLSVNPAGASMYGYDSPEDMIQSVTDIAQQIYVHPGDPKRFLEALKVEGSVNGFEVEHYRKDGTKIWASMNASVIYDAKATSTPYYEITSENVTVRKQLEAQLLQSQKMEAVGTLAGGIAHDFNNILMALMGYGSLLQTTLGKDSPLQAYVEQILSSSQKAANLTKSLLTFSRQQPVDLKPVNLNQIIRGTEKLLRRLVIESISLETNLTFQDAVIMADTTQIDQILFNLAANAGDSMPEGGKLTIATELIDFDSTLAEIHGFGKPGRYVLLSISDTGSGIDEKTREKIFDPFFTTKEAGKGTGLGLATVYGIVKQHEGHVTVSSKLNSGTTFRIYFPAVVGLEEENRDAPSQSITPGKETILVAEDNKDVRHLIRDVLKTYGYIVLEAVDGVDAVATFENNRGIDLVILDSVMPRKNGWAAYNEIYRIDRDVKVLFISGYTRDGYLDRGIAEKGLPFLAKPMYPGTLLQLVREILDGKTHAGAPQKSMQPT